MDRVKVAPETVTVLGYKAKAGEPLWEGLLLDRAEPAAHSLIMLAICGKDAPIDPHLRVPWCHPDERTGAEDDWTGCVYRVRPRMRTGKKWEGKVVTSVAFERWNGEWWIAYSTR